MSGKTRILVATVAFGMGLNKADIGGIIHYNVPRSPEVFLVPLIISGPFLKHELWVLISSPPSPISLSFILSLSLLSPHSSSPMSKKLVERVVMGGWLVAMSSLIKRTSPSSPRSLRSTSPFPDHDLIP